MKPHQLWIILPIILHTWGASTLDEDTLEAISKRYTKRTPNGVHIPIVRREVKSLVPRGTASAAIGLGNFLDVAYTALVTVGGATTPVIIDTGSSDLWVMSDACTEGCTGSINLFPQATFKSAGIDITLNYGDSRTGTFAAGLVGTDTVDVAGITLKEQSFAAIDRTNTSLAEIGAAGILGLGFPVNSVAWSQMFQASLPANISGEALKASSEPLARRVVKFGSAFSGFNFRRLSFPSITGMLEPQANSPPAARHETRQAGSSGPTRFDAALASFPKIGPFVPRLITQNMLAQPLISVTLQRNTIDIGGVGMLSIGELPLDVDVNEMTWVGLRKYSRDEGGLPAPSDSPNESYPITWEIVIDNVYLDGEKLPRSTLAPASLGYSALVDTGNSLLRGPLDLVQWIDTKLGNQGLFRCSEPHTLSFEIGGKLFPVDPRDFIGQQFRDNVDACVSTVVPTDPPEVGSYLFSWSLGTPFLKSVVASFYFGNITHPSQDEPRMGLLSTVPNNAGDLLKDAVDAANKGRKNFAATSNPAPSGTAAPGSNINSSTNPKTSSTRANSAKQTYSRTSLFFTLSAVLVSAWSFELW